MTIQNAVASGTVTLDQTSWTTITSMTITPGAGDYLATYSMVVEQNASPSANLVRIAIFVNGVQQTHTVRELGGDTSLPASQTTLATHCLVSPTAGQVVDVRYQITTGNSFTCDFRELTLLPAEQGTYQDTATGDDTISSATWATLGSMTRTPGAGDYLLIFTTHAETESEEVGGFRLSVGGSPVAHTVRQLENETSVENLGYVVMIAASISPNGSQVVEIEWQRNSGSGTVTCHERTMTLIEVDSGDIFQATGTAADADSTTSEVLIDDMTISAPGAGDYLVLFSAYQFTVAASGDVDTYYRIFTDGTVEADSERQMEWEASIDDVYLPCMASSKITLASGNIQMYWQANASDTRTMYARTLVAIADPSPPVFNYPVVESTNSGTTAGSATHVISMPAGIEAGDLLLVFFGTDSNNTITNWGGFTELGQESNGTANYFAIGYKIAVGSDTLTLTVSDTNEPGAHATYRISGWDSGQIPELSTVAEGSDQFPDPTIVTPTGGAKDYLWIHACGWDRDRSVSAWNANFTLNRLNETSGGSGGTCIGVSARKENVASKDPGPITISNADTWIAWTVAVHPEAGITNSVTLLSDARIADTYSIQLLSDGRIADTYFIQKLSDSRIKRIESVQLFSNSRIKAPVSVQLLSDGRIFDVYSIQKLSDSRIKSIEFIQKLSDGRVLNSYNVQLLSEGRVFDTYFVQLLSDAKVALASFNVQLYSNSRIKKAFSVQLLSDGRIFDVYSVQLLSDGRIKKAFSVQLLSDGRIFAINNVQLLSNSRIFDVYSVQLLSDAKITTGETNSIQLYSNSRIFDVYSIQKLSDSRITDTYNVQLLSNTRIKVAYNVQLLSDGRIFDTYFIQLLSDASIFSSSSIQLFSNSRIKKAFSVQLLSDGRINRVNSIQLTSDALIFYPPIIDIHDIEITISKSNEINMFVEKSSNIEMKVSKDNEIKMIVEKKGIER